MKTFSLPGSAAVCAAGLWGSCVFSSTVARPKKITRLKKARAVPVPHSVTNISLGVVTEKFDPLEGLFGEIFAHYSQWYQLKTPHEVWRDASDHDCQHAYLFQAPAGFTFSFGPQVLSIHHVSRFHRFCTNLEEQQLIRKFTHQVLKLMPGDRAIYSPDQGIGDVIYDWIFCGRSFSEIESFLSQLGTPPSSFAELDACSPQQPKYYIDRFEDFQTSKGDVRNTGMPRTS